MKQAPIAAAVLLVSVALAGCATPPKERTAPCKRPANAMAYGPDIRVDCGPASAVNADAAATFAAIDLLQDH